MKTYDILNAGPKNRFMANGKIVSNSGRAIQLQNLVRNELSTLNEARELIKLGCFDMVESIYANTPDVLSQLIRTMLIPKHGHEFIVADFSAIEARVLSWLAGEQWRLDAFNRGEDIYCASASAMFGVPVVKHGVNGELRAKGKVAELACGYQGSVGALEAFGALKMGLKEDDLSEIIQNWRQANPKIVQFWYDLENAAMETITDREEREVGKISVQFYGKTLWLVLPSGRKLAYINPKLEPNRFGKMSVTFMGLNLANKWDRIESYGGKLAENCIAEGTLVMTDQGLIPIESIKPDSLIWDGVEWVHHEGVIYKGLQETIEISSGNSDCKSNCNSDCNSVAMYSIYSIYSRYSGIYMTPEHKILTEKGWCECGKSDGLNWAEVRLPDGFETIRHWEMGRSTMGRFMRMWKYCKRFAIGINKKKVSQTLLRLPAKKSLYRLNRSDVSLSHSVTKSRKQRPRQGTIFVPLYMRKRNHNSCCRAKEAQNKIMRMHEQTINKQSPYNAWNEPASGIWSMAQYETTMPRSEPFCISQLWRAGYNSLRSLDTQLREFLGRHGPHMAKGARFRSYRQQQGILSRELSLDNSKKQFQKQKNKSNIL